MAKTAEERDVCLASEKLFRRFAEADRKITQVRDRNPSLFARRDPRPLPVALRPERALRADQPEPVYAVWCNHTFWFAYGSVASPFQYQ